MSLPCIPPSQMQNAEDARTSPQALIKTQWFAVLQDSELFRSEKGNTVPIHYSNTHSGSIIRHINGECVCSVIADFLSADAMDCSPWSGKESDMAEHTVQVLNGGDATVWEQFSLSQQGWAVLQSSKAERPAVLLNTLQPHNQALTLQCVSSMEAENHQAGF